ncbi:uncharacterized protein PG986_008450 [Apiospora aurea]|uniref:non-specific serine/threonine protein kinase n=1 Tax=Apiospora aurea TaxID=335848 RepID=A0ABR1QFG8_9PEZI
MNPTEPGVLVYRQCAEFQADISRKNRIGRQCKGGEAKIFADCETVRQDYLRIFSTLVLMQVASRLPWLHYLNDLITRSSNDASLPWTEAPPPFHWRIRLRSIPQAPMAVLSRTQQPIQYAVFKTYRTTLPFHDELEAYQAIRNKNIVNYYGSFQWYSETGDHYFTIILEFAEEGSLYDLYKSNDPPTSSEEIRKFWKGLVGLVEGVEALHNHVNGHGYTIIHQDLKPSNVLVLRNNTRPQSPFQFKIGDLGASTVKYGPPPQRDNGPDTGAGKTYGPPELHLGHTIDYTVGPHVDIWALGCILTEAAVWVCFGEPGRQRFRQARMRETSTLSDDHRALGSEDAFHDGSKALKCVQDAYQWISSDGRRCDDNTMRIVEYVLANCLAEYEARPIARAVRANLNKILYCQPTTPLRDSSSLSSTMSREHRHRTSVNGSEAYEHVHGMVQEAQALHRPPSNPAPYFQDTAGDRVPPELAASPEPTRGSLHQPRPSTTGSQNHSTSPGMSDPPNGIQSPATPSSPRPRDLSVLINGSSGPGTSPYPPSNNDDTSLREITYKVVLDWMAEGKKSRSKTELSGWKQAQSALKNRDYIIVVDNSKTMQTHSQEASGFAKALSYLIKKLDRDGFEVFFTSAPTAKTVCKTSSDVEALFNKSFLDGHNANCRMEYTLGKVLTDVVRPKLGQKTAAEGGSTKRIFSRRAKVSAVSIYVLTTGVWDESSDGTCGVETPIESLIAYMRKNDVGRTDAMIQFVSFGSNERGIRRLVALDDELPQKEACKGFDIVDHKRSHDSIWKILEGSISKGNDG